MSKQFHNYQKAKKLSRLQLERQYMLNGSVYVHHNPANFIPQTNVGAIEGLVRQVYLDQAKKLKEVAAKNMGTDEETAAKIIHEITQVVAGKIGEGRSGKAIEKGSGLASSGISSLDGLSFSQISRAASKAKNELIYDGAQLDTLIKEIENIIKGVSDLSPEELTQVAVTAQEAFKNARPKTVENIKNGFFEFTKARPKIWYDEQTKVLAPDFNIIPRSSKANTSLLRLITGYERLKQIRAIGDTGGEIGREGNHIISKLGGLINSVGTSGTEVTIAKSLSTATILANEVVAEFVNSNNYVKSALAGQAAGETTVSFDPDADLPLHYKELVGEAYTSKSDVNIEFRQRGKTSGEIDFKIGLNIKDYKASKAGTISPTFLGGGNYKDYLIRSSVYKTELEYDLINSIAQKYCKAEKDEKGKYAKSSFTLDNYNAIKKLVAAKSAFNSIVGLGTKQDTAYLVVFTNRVITTHEMFTKMGTGEMNSLNLSIAGEENIKEDNKFYDDKEKDSIQDAYTRSRRVLSMSYTKFKVSVHGSRLKI